ncbi:unnamed protein product [Polarella glacialis]|uniref:DAGKc domain-containing protein n=1 Tax=Polarella glacialis TaxID=89957 RepID=A0A813HD27_POLGL|nr:unnamed protein product [Polarella glacialis]
MAGGVALFAGHQSLVAAARTRPAVVPLFSVEERVAGSVQLRSPAWNRPREVGIGGSAVVAALVAHSVKGQRRRHRRSALHRGQHASGLLRPAVDGDHKDISVHKAQVALVLNRNAKGVGAAMEKKLREIVGDDNCFSCGSEEDAATALQQVLDRGHYAVVACGGGDGTIAGVLNRLEEFNQRTSSDVYTPVVPALCVLRLGTGNGLAYLVGARPDPVKDLRQLVDHVSEVSSAAAPALFAKTLELTTGWRAGKRRQGAAAEGLEEGLLEAEASSPSTSSSSAASGKSSEDEEESHRTLCFFAGLGYDARILQDYNWLKKRTNNSFLKRLVQNPLGYCLALLLRTLPATMRGEHVFHVKITNLSDEAFYVDPRRGDWAEPRHKGEVLYEGVAGIVSVGAVPFYGGGLRLFPFAGLAKGLAHLRLSSIHPAVATLNVLPIWRGSYRNAKKVHDFLVKDVLVEVDRPTPFQHSGEFMGNTTRMRIRVQSDGSTRLVDYLGDWNAERA